MFCHGWLILVNISYIFFYKLRDISKSGVLNCYHALFECGRFLSNFQYSRIDDPTEDCRNLLFAFDTYTL